jgi:hypothetical protein
MSEPAALTKAASLYRFAMEQGAPLETFQLALTDTEALEVLDWFGGQMQPNAAFEVDLEIAHRTGKPFEMLSSFQLMGLAIVAASLVVN